MCLILLSMITGALGGFAIAVIKCSTELIKNEGEISYLVIILFSIGLVMCSAQMIFFNLAMKIYD